MVRIVTSQVLDDDEEGDEDRAGAVEEDESDALSDTGPVRCHRQGKKNNNYEVKQGSGHSSSLSSSI